MCAIEDCDNNPIARGLCGKHYRWFRMNGGLEQFDKLARTSKDRWINTDTGYVMVKVNGKLTYEHRVLAEKALGKPLPEGAVIHHTGNRDDNHGYCKLVICPNQEYHQLLHERMGHAINQYR